MKKLACVCGLALVLGACGDDGSAPEISNLSLDPDAVPAGQQTNVNAFFDFSDPDGDVDTVEVTLRAGGQENSLETDLMNAGGMTDGMAQVIIVLTAQAPLPIDVSIVAIDEAGNRSNTLTGTIEESSMAGDPCVEGSCLDAAPTIEDAFVVY
jgi:hypothetical protein